MVNETILALSSHLCQRSAVPDRDTVSPQVEIEQQVRDDDRRRI